MDAHTALDTERSQIHELVRMAMTQVQQRIAALRGNLTARAANLNRQVDVMIADQTKNNAEQAAAIAALRTDYEGNKTLDFSRLDTDDKRLEQLFAALDLAQKTLRAQSVRASVVISALDSR